MNKYGKIRKRLLPVRGWMSWKRATVQAGTLVTFEAGLTSMLWQGLGNVVPVTATGWIW